MPVLGFGFIIGLGGVFLAKIPIPILSGLFPFFACKALFYRVCKKSKKPRF